MYDVIFVFILILVKSFTINNRNNITEILTLYIDSMTLNSKMDICYALG